MTDLWPILSLSAGIGLGFALGWYYGHSHRMPPMEGL